MRRWLDRSGARRRVLSTTKMALQYIMANAKLYTPREYPPCKVYIHVTSRLYTHAHKRTRCYTHPLTYTHTHTHTYPWHSVCRENAWWRSKKGGNYMYGVNEMRGAQSTSASLYIYVYTNTHTHLCMELQQPISE